MSVIVHGRDCKCADCQFENTQAFYFCTNYGNEDHVELNDDYVDPVGKVVNSYNNFQESFSKELT
jgi:hypothetical protein